MERVAVESPMLERCEKMLTRPGLGEEIGSALTSSDGATEELVTETVEWVMGMRRELLTLLRTIDDPEQIIETLAINYIELKTKWIALNTKANYHIFRTGAPDAAAAFRGCGCSLLLGDVERLLMPSDIQKITEFLSQPVARAA
jgi:hypothetical protein